MAKDFFHTGLQVGRSDLNFGLSVQPPGQKFFVSRNVAISGDGSSWAEAFKTIGEGIAALNLAATNDRWLSPGGRNTVLYIDEGWYSETGLTLSASDCTIISMSPGSRINDGTVLYGSATAGGFDAGAVIPALRITGSSVSILNMSFMNSASGLYPCITVGTQGSSGPSSVLFKGCSFVRDVADAYTYAIEDLSNEGTKILNSFFSQSAKTAGIQIATNGVTNPVNNHIEKCIFIGTPIGINQDNGHNTRIIDNEFMDATDDRPDTCDNPIVVAASSAYTTRNISYNTNRADLCTGAAFSGGTALDLNNFGSDDTNT